MECTKAGFLNEKYADEHVRRIRKKNKVEGKKLPIRSYKCEKCNKFHLTSQVNLKESIKQLEGDVEVLDAKLKMISGKNIELKSINKVLRKGEMAKVVIKLIERTNALKRRNATIEKMKKENENLMSRLILANLKNLENKKDLA